MSKLEELMSGLREKLRGGQGGKIFVEDVRDAIDIPTQKRGEGSNLSQARLIS